MFNGLFVLYPQYASSTWSHTPPYVTIKNVSKYAKCPLGGKTPLLFVLQTVEQWVAGLGHTMQIQSLTATVKTEIQWLNAKCRDIQELFQHSIQNEAARSFPPGRRLKACFLETMTSTGWKREKYWPLEVYQLIIHLNTEALGREGPHHGLNPFNQCVTLLLLINGRQPRITRHNRKASNVKDKDQNKLIEKTWGKQNMQREEN